MTNVLNRSDLAVVLKWPCIALTVLWLSCAGVFIIALFTQSDPAIIKSVGKGVAVVAALPFYGLLLLLLF